MLHYGQTCFGNVKKTLEGMLHRLSGSPPREELDGYLTHHGPVKCLTAACTCRCPPIPTTQHFLSVSKLWWATWPSAPSCLRSRYRRAMTAPIAACRPARESPREILGRTGARSGKPLRWRKPPYASHTLAYPGISAFGPVWPYPEIRVYTRAGLRSCKHHYST